MAVKTYRGNCHCTAYVFEVSLPELKTGRQCNCSFCYKRGCVVYPTNADNISFVKGDAETLATYTFGSGKFKHKFCSHCGSYLFCEGPPAVPADDEDPTTQTWINLRVLQNVNVWDLDISTTDGASLQPAREPPHFPGPAPSAPVDGGRTYTGSCHCGAVTLALATKPLDSTYEDRIIECDCSICMRNAYIWVYPSKPHVSLAGAENLSHYAFGRRIWRKTFCRTCGVPLTNDSGGATDARLDALEEEERAWTRARLGLAPVNVRVLEAPGLDVGALQVQRVRGSVLRGPAYVNP
ncbi:glutathione-dependent formaldehyde-activating enzyme [Xylariaceae sp. FL0016]|nr:glutathione-dependent formaldehyde-activating enzyme [Xylariaceae sp. FL0016]